VLTTLGKNYGHFSFFLQILSHPFPLNGIMNELVCFLGEIDRFSIANENSLANLMKTVSHFI